MIDGSNNPTLNLLRGFTYTFNINATGHPFYIKTAQTTGTGNQYTSGVTGNSTQSGTLTFAVPYNAPSTLYYICQYHTAMKGTISISDVGPTGAQGATGATGAHGATGAEGTDGANGAKGNLEVLQVPKVQRDLQVLKVLLVQEDQLVHKVLLVLLQYLKLKKQKIRVSFILLILLHTLELH